MNYNQIQIYYCFVVSKGLLHFVQKDFLFDSSDNTISEIFNSVKEIQVQNVKMYSLVTRAMKICHLKYDK